MKTIYLAGPMRGYDQYNFPAFHQAAERLRESYMGVELLSPAEHDLENGFDPTKDIVEQENFDLREALTWDTAAVLRSDLVFVLPGWDKSRGAQAEVALAWACGIPVYTFKEYLRVWPDGERCPQPEDGPEVVETITTEAERLVYGDRGAAYGPPDADFRRTGGIWTALLEHKLGAGEEIDAKDVALCMVGLKMSREVHRPKRDNRVDLAGYALCLDRIETGR